MRILILNQAFWPDVAATGQYAADLAAGLTARGHAVTVIASRRGYDDPAVRYAARECWRGVDVRRAWCAGFSKKTKIGRVVNFVSFLVGCGWVMVRAGRFDVVVAMTTPPLLSVLAAALQSNGSHE